MRAMLLEQFQAFWGRDTGIERTQLAELARAAPLPHAVIISGLRRAGKSTLLAQLAHRLGEDKFYYVNFEDERFLGFAADDANDLYALLVELFGERGVFVIDEIQNVPGWSTSSAVSWSWDSSSTSPARTRRCSAVSWAAD